MPARTFKGHMIDVEYDGSTLVARGEDDAAHYELMNQEHDHGDLVLRREEIASAVFEPVSGLFGSVSGRITVRTTDGREFILLFRKKHQEEWAELDRMLNGTSPA